MKKKKQTDAQTREALIEGAYHEAGHAVVGNAFSQEIKWMWIETRQSDHPDWFSGMTFFNPERFIERDIIEAGHKLEITKQNALIKNLIVIYFAGLVAQGIHRDPLDHESLASRYKAGEMLQAGSQEFH